MLLLAIPKFEGVSVTVASGAWEMWGRARFGAASAFKAAVPGSLFENAGLGYTVL